jgi:hypothetical protein
MGDKSLKILVGKYIINRQCILTPTGREIFLKAKQHKFLIEKCLLQSIKIDKAVNYLFDEIKSIAELSKNPKFESMIKNPKTSFIRARNSIIGNGNVRLSQAQCIDMILPELIEEVNKLNNIAQIMISPKRIGHFLESMKVFHLFVNLLKKSYVIISEVKKSVKKRDLDMKYQAKDFDNDFLMEEIDINSIADSNSIDLSASEYDTTLNSSEIGSNDIYSNYNDDMQQPNGS